MRSDGDKVGIELLACIVDGNGSVFTDDNLTVGARKQNASRLIDRGPEVGSVVGARMVKKLKRTEIT